MVPFTKMHGCGNDYVYLDGIRDALPPKPAWPALARRVSDRHTGVGSDGLIVLLPSRRGDARMVMLNADGSTAEMCGNGLRCCAKLAWDHGHVRSRALRFETGAGILPVRLLGNGKACTGASVDMGAPRLTPEAVPVTGAGRGPLLHLSMPWAGHRQRLVAVGMGNPHAVWFVPDPEHFPVHEAGPKVEHDRRFPRRTNVEFVARLPDEGGLPVLRQRTWERGAGETQACGTGACAVLVAAVLEGVIPGREAIIRLNGGDLRIAWPADDAVVTMTGPAETVFTGRI